MYARAWVFCLPSSYEGFGIPYAEAMSAGLPVVSTRNPGSRYVTDEGRSGLLVDDDRVGPELRDLLLDDSRRTEYEKAGRVRAELFSLDNVVSSYEQLYREVISARAGMAAS